MSICQMRYAALADYVHLPDARLSFMVEHWDAWEYRNGREVPEEPWKERKTGT